MGFVWVLWWTSVWFLDSFDKEIWTVMEKEGKRNEETLARTIVSLLEPCLAQRLKSLNFFYQCSIMNENSILDEK